jgi:hypothetical protein
MIDLGLQTSAILKNNISLIFWCGLAEPLADHVEVPSVTLGNERERAQTYS